MRNYLMVSAQVLNCDAIFFNSIMKKCVKNIIDFSGDQSYSKKSDFMAMKKVLEKANNHIFLLEVDDKKLAKAMKTEEFKRGGYEIIEKNLDSFSQYNKEDKWIFIQMADEILERDRIHKSKFYHLHIKK